MKKNTLPAENEPDTASERARADALFASVGEPLIATDEYGKITRINEPATIALGLSEKELVGKTFLGAIKAYDMEANEIEPLNRPIMRALVEGRSITTNLLYVKDNGVRFPVTVTTSPVMLEGNPIGVIEVFRDITREQQIDRAKTEFVSLASHQLRTPLTAVRWYVELLLKGRMGELTEEQYNSLQEIYESNLRMIDLVNALLSVARIEVGTLTAAPEPSDIIKLAKEAVAELKPQVTEKKINFTETYDEAIPKMPLDPDLTRIIFQNLLTNAIKYTPDDGKVSLKIEFDGKYVLIVVSDTGYGIPKNQQDQLFTKLFRADNVRKKDTDGTGLGLYIVRSIVKDSKGKIWFESEEDQGTTFYVALPLRGMLAAAVRSEKES